MTIRPDANLYSQTRPSAGLQHGSVAQIAQKPATAQCSAVILRVGSAAYFGKTAVENATDTLRAHTAALPIVLAAAEIHVRNVFLTEKGPARVTGAGLRIAKAPFAKCALVAAALRAWFGFFARFIILRYFFTWFSQTKLRRDTELSHENKHNCYEKEWSG